ncbi:ATP-binding cassette domain-containing protein [Arachnia propionica]|uniref:ATP-binding cassette domain-containing protein n=1 Tax=Arachnia propionica TaxID=1750 RepID=A0A3P1WXD5_9ACTN|nr:ATP-binding cassette domain-containing protein [Arachnia propionica]RRD50706.1 ATP-binding cassette domain-containing protein [Arachnia propionica]
MQALKRRPVRTPSLIQMEAVECGAASLGILLRNYGRIEPLERLRIACNVTRDGANAAAILTAAESYGLVGAGKVMDIDDLSAIRHPVIIHWAFQHFMVLEGFQQTRHGVVVHVNDPANGHRAMSFDEFDGGFTGVVLDLVPGTDFVKGGKDISIVAAVKKRLRGSGSALALTLFATTLVAAPGVLGPIIQRWFVNSLGQEGLDSSIPVMLLLLCAGITAILIAIQREHLRRVEIFLGLKSATHFVRELMRRPVAFFQQRYAADLSRRIDANFRVSTSLTNNVVVTLASVTLILVYGIVLLAMDPLLALLVMLVSALNMIVLRKVLREQRDAASSMQARDAGLANSTMQTLSTIASVKGNGTEQLAFAKWSGHCAKAVSEGQRLGRGQSLITVLPGMLAGVNTVLVLVVGGLRVASGMSGAGLIVAFQALLASFTQPLVMLVNQASQLQITQADLARLEDVLNYEGEPDDGAETVEVLSGRMEFEKVCFSFDGETSFISDLSFVVEPGMSVALVGASGSGKSTVGRLAAGLLQPTSGRILLDGRPRGEHSKHSVCSAVSYVDQSVTLFEGTVKDNVTLWDDTVSERSVLRALEDAEVLAAVTQRAGGVNAFVATGGRNFSGGQRQRLELARALTNEPSLLILDEATSATDTVTERGIITNLRRRGCAMLVIAHRLSTVRDADLILVFEQGQLVEQGTHESLVDSGGTYSKLQYEMSTETRAAS